MSACVYSDSANVTFYKSPMEGKLSQEYKHNLTKMFAHSNTEAPVHGPERDKGTKADGRSRLVKDCQVEKRDTL